MFFASWLLHQPLLAAIATPKSGPDFESVFGAQKIWIECTAPWPKDEEQKISYSAPPRGGFVISEPYIIAITGAVRDKLPQLRNPAVQPSDIRLIAINLGTGRDVNFVVWDDPPLLAQALLGVGPTGYQMPVSDGRAETEKICAVPTFKETLSSQQGSPIGLRGFLDGSLSTVSGAFFSSHRYNDCPKPEGSQFDFLHNPTAAVPCPRNVFKNVREYEVADGFLREVV